MSVKLIEKIRSIQPLAVNDEQKILGQIKLLNFKKNDFLLSEGQICRYIYYVESGFVKSIMNDDGNEISLSFTFGNNFVTNLKSLRNATPSEYTIVVCEPSVIWRFEKNSLVELYKESAEITSFGRNLLEQLLIEQEEHANLFKLKTSSERYQYIVKNNPLLLQKITLTQLSSYIGVSRETLSRIRAKNNFL